jgi:hypothetical protein
MEYNSVIIAISVEKVFHLNAPTLKGMLVNKVFHILQITCSHENCRKLFDARWFACATAYSKYQRIFPLTIFLSRGASHDAQAQRWNLFL